MQPSAPALQMIAAALWAAAAARRVEVVAVVVSESAASVPSPAAVAGVGLPGLQVEAVHPCLSCVLFAVVLLAVQNCTG